MIRRTWSDFASPVAISYSHSDPAILAETHFRVTAQLRARKWGATVTQTEGFWEGASEPGYRVEVLIPDDDQIERLVTAAISGGCEAIQVERLPQRHAAEWRAY